MSHLLLDPCETFPTLDVKRCKCVAQIMKPDLSKLRVGGRGKRAFHSIDTTRLRPLLFVVRQIDVVYDLIISVSSACIPRLLKALLLLISSTFSLELMSI